MPKPMQFNAGNAVYVEGEKDERIFVLQSGMIVLSSADIVTGTQRQELVQPGEFFGVKSALGKYPREETANVVQNCSLVMFSVPEFELMAVKNPRIVLQMLKVYSAQLRKISGILSSAEVRTNVRAAPPSSSAGQPVKSAAAKLSHEEGLYKNGSFFLKKQKYNEASYIFTRYLQYYPAGKYAAQARDYLNIIGSKR